MSTPLLKLQVLPHGEGLPLPAYATAGSAGMDLRAAVDGTLVLSPGERGKVPTGVCLEIPAGFEGQVRARSGLAFRHGLAIVNAPGTIDSDYRGEVGVLVINLGQESLTIARGDRIAQLVIAPIAQVKVQVVASVDKTDRGVGGFGSTGQH